MNAFEINASIAALANLLAAGMSNKELAYWGVIIAHLGESMGTLAALGEFSEATADGAGILAADAVSELGPLDNTSVSSQLLP